MAEIACAKAERMGMAYAICKNGTHVGRLGAYVQKVAARGMMGIATSNNRKIGHVVAPWGGREGRLGTNPFAYAAPTKGWPVVLDMSTCMIAEGKVSKISVVGVGMRSHAGVAATNRGEHRDRQRLV